MYTRLRLISCSNLGTGRVERWLVPIAFDIIINRFSKWPCARRLDHRLLVFKRWVRFILIFRIWRRWKGIFIIAIFISRRRRKVRFMAIAIATTNGSVTLATEASYAFIKRVDFLREVLAAEVTDEVLKCSESLLIGIFATNRSLSWPCFQLLEHALNNF